MSEMREVVAKRYNLIRQSVEIYFDDHSSIFFNFFSRDRRIRFMMALKATVLPGNPKMTLIRKPEKFFIERHFPERWSRGEFSNFEYLSMLNKYGGRSFSDLGQYPIFPWILKDYASPSLPYRSETLPIYRDLKLPIAAISESKRREADQKFSAMFRDGGNRSFQFAAHYLPAKVVADYLSRVEPFASVAAERGDGAAFCSLERAWQSVVSDPADNRELIPEMFYSPEVLLNQNCYCFSSDVVALPNWAKDRHRFIEQHALALESPYVSHSLNNWVDLVFGIKQQDPRVYNLFRELCEETAVRKRRKTLTEENLAEIQALGTIPVKLFRQLHPERDGVFLAFKTELSLFDPPDKSFVLRKLASVQEPVVGIFAATGRTLVLGNSGALYKVNTVPAAGSCGSATMFDFHTKVDALRPRRKPFNGVRKQYLYDGQRATAPLLLDENTCLLLYSGFYDRTFKTLVLSNGASPELVDNPRFEEVLSLPTITVQ